MNKIISNIYSIAPVFIQDCMISVKGLLLANERYSNIYKTYLNSLKDRDVTNVKALKDIQNRQFLSLLHHAIHNSPFYKEFYKDVDISSIKSVEDIQKLPILDKETLRKNLLDVYTISPRKGIKSVTGGTTGKSLTVYYTHEDYQRRMAYLSWFKWLHGFNANDETSARFNGKDIIPLHQKSKTFWRNNWCIKQRIYSSFFISQENIPYYIKNLNEYKPREMDGFVTTMFDIAKYMKRNGIEAEYSPVAIFPTSETVTKEHRELLSSIFHAPVRDQYASSEGAPFIIEFPDGYMHECIDTGVFEHVKSDCGTKLIVTSFTTYGTPLIRYDIGDNIIECTDEDHPDMTIAFPAIKAIDGRKADYLYSQERGNINLGNLSNTIKYLPNSIINIQFIQESIDYIKIKLVVDKTIYVEEHQDLILHEMVARFGNKMKFDFEYVDEIPRTKGGKYRLIINNYSNNK